MLVEKPDLVLSFLVHIEVLLREVMDTPTFHWSLHLPFLLEVGLPEIFKLTSALGWKTLPNPNTCAAQCLNLQHPYDTSQVSPVSWPIS